MINQHIFDAPTDEVNHAGLEQDPTRTGAVILSKYTVEKTLGQGGMGLVVAARHHHLEELHAIKFLLPGTNAKHQVTQRFLREARAAARLKNEHVVRVQDVGTTPDGHLYMVMEYLEGTNLKSALAEGPLAISDIVACVLQICEALSEAHAAGIVHRDLKPANLHLWRDMHGAPHIKVLDFGIAKFVDSDLTNLTNKAELLGTLLYMSPEQILDSGKVDQRSDIWALGVVFYELVTGEKPFGGYTQIDVVSAITRREPIPPSELRRELPVAIESVILRCLRKDTDERYQTAQELAAALKNAAAMGTSVAPPPRERLSTLPSRDDGLAGRDDKTRPEFVLPPNPAPIKDDRWKIFAAAIGAMITLMIAVFVLRILNGSSGQTQGTEGTPSASVSAASPPSKNDTAARADNEAPISTSVATSKQTATAQTPKQSNKTPGPSTGKTKPSASASSDDSVPKFKYE